MKDDSTSAGLIVLVEPDDLIRNLLQCWLDDAGYAIAIGTAQGVPATSAPDVAPRLILANVHDPSGAAAFIRSLRKAYASPILIISARFRRGLGTSVEVARRLGVRMVLPKPFTREELLNAVSECLSYDPGPT